LCCLLAKQTLSSVVSEFLAIPSVAWSRAALWQQKRQRDKDRHELGQVEKTKVKRKRQR